MKHVAFIAALPFALSLAACGDSVDGTDTADLEADAVEPMDQGMSEPDETMSGTSMTGEERAEMLDESAEADEEAADRVEDTDEAAADALEASAEAKQDERDAID